MSIVRMISAFSCMVVAPICGVSDFEVKLKDNN